MLLLPRLAKPTSFRMAIGTPLRSLLLLSYLRTGRVEPQCVHTKCSLARDRTIDRSARECRSRWQPHLHVPAAVAGERLRAQLQRRCYSLADLEQAADDPRSCATPCQRARQHGRPPLLPRSARRQLRVDGRIHRHQQS